MSTVQLLIQTVNVQHQTYSEPLMRKLYSGSHSPLMVVPSIPFVSHWTTSIILAMECVIVSLV